MKRTEKRTKPVTRDELVEMTCDLCGAKAPPESDEWERPSTEEFEKNPRSIEVTVKMEDRWHSRYPDGGGDAKYTEFDLCPDCFGRLAEWLRSQGAEPRQTESEW
jgi:hypothetical protein